MNFHCVTNFDYKAFYSIITPEAHWQIMVTGIESAQRKVIPAAQKKHGPGTPDQITIIADVKDFGCVFNLITGPVLTHPSCFNT
jgi:hypothetical protein